MKYYNYIEPKRMSCRRKNVKINIDEVDRAVH